MRSLRYVRLRRVRRVRGAWAAFWDDGACVGLKVTLLAALLLLAALI